MKKLLFILSLSVATIFSCQSDDKITPITNEIKSIKAGQSFGMCIGRCYAELYFDQKKVTLTQIERLERGGGQNTIQNTDNTNLDKLVKLAQNLSVDDFMQLKEFYGCPDCADGGAEWITIELNNGLSKRVNFEYGASLEGFSNLVSTLRQERLSLISKTK